MSDENKTTTVNGWNQWGKFVLKELERLSGCVEALRQTIISSRETTSHEIAELREDMNRQFVQTKDELYGTMRKNEKDVAKEIQTISESVLFLKFKAGLWGALAGAIPVLIAILVYVIKFRMEKG